jgi:ATP-dependent Clp protease ATP-binding subunit ClpA
MYPFERFTDQAKRTLTLAQEEAERAHHSYIGTEHLLLGMMRGEGMAAAVLQGLGIEIETVRTMIDKVLGRNERIIIQQIIPTSRVKRAIELGFEEARQTGSSSVSTGHLLLGLLLEAGEPGVGHGVASAVLGDMGVTVDGVRERMAELTASGLVEHGSPQPAGPGAQPTWVTSQRQVRAWQSQTGADLVHRGDDIQAVEMLAALMDRFGVTTRPPERLLELAAALRTAQLGKQKASAAQEYEEAARHRDEEKQIQEDFQKELEAWRRSSEA